MTWRGQPGVKDEPQHEQMGRIMHQLLDTLEIPWLPFPQEESAIADDDGEGRGEHGANAAAVRARDGEGHDRAARARRARSAATRRRPICARTSRGGEKLTRTEALELILADVERR